MILHFSHIGLTDGRTFTLIRSQKLKIFLWILGPALATAAVAATAPKRHTQHRKIALQAHRGMVAGVLSYTSGRTTGRAWDM
jgi:hypothetical protein